MSGGPPKSLDKASRRKSSLKGCKNQEMYQTPHLSHLQNDVSIHELVNSLRRAMPFLNYSQGHVRKTCSEKTGLLTGSDSLDSFGRSGFPSLSYPGGEKHGTESFRVHPKDGPL